MSKDVLVECEVFEGMFSDEAIVDVADRSFIVPKTAVEVGTDPKQGRVRAKLVTNDTGEWVVLPTVYSESVPRAKTTIVNG